MQIYLNDLLIKPPSDPDWNESQYCFWGSVRQFKKNYGNICKWSFAEQNKGSGQTPTPTLCKKHTTFFTANWVIKFIYTRRKATKKKRTLQNFRDFFFISGSNWFFCRGLPGISVVSMQRSSIIFYEFSL